MKLMVDLNVLLDVFQHREPHYDRSAQVLNEILEGRQSAYIPNHAIGTVYYLIAKYKDKVEADGAVDWMLSVFDVPVCGKDVFQRARKLEFNDFEDAVVAALAEQEGCDYVVTRNVRDYTNSPVPGLSPDNLLAEIQAEKDHG